MKNNKLLLAASLLAASSLATASYTELQLYQTGDATVPYLVRGDAKLQTETHQVSRC